MGKKLIAYLKGKTKHFLLIFICLSGFIGAKACDIINGSDIIYKWISGRKYAIKYVLYHQCQCKLSILPTFTAKIGSSTITTGAKRISYRDITLTCSKQFPPCLPNGTSSGGRYGIEEHIFVDTIDFGKSPYASLLTTNCKVKLQVKQPWGLVSTTTSTTTYGGECEIDLCKIGKKGNNSPTFSNIPMTFMCCNIPFTFNNGAVDELDGDSLSFELDDPLDANFGAVSWKSPWSKKFPLTPYCPGNPGKVNCTVNVNAKPPIGFFFDTFLGDITLTPTKCDESGPISVRVIEWRLDSLGAWQQIGYTRRDIFVNVIDCGYNKPPTIQAQQTWKVCEGTKLCFTIKTKDEPFTPHQTIGDTTKLFWSKTIPGATFTIQDTTVREKAADFCWTPKIGQARKAPYTFTAKVLDDFCPTPGQSIKGFSIIVKEKASGTRFYQNLTCGRLFFKVTPAASIADGATCKWSFKDSTGKELHYSIKKSDTTRFKYGQRLFVTLTLNTSDNCPTVYKDTWTIPDPPIVFLKDTFQCHNLSYDVLPNVRFAKIPFKYYWSRPSLHLSGDTLSHLPIDKVTQDSTLIVVVTDGNGCVFTDTATILHKPLPKVDLGIDRRICTYDSVIFDAGHNDTVKYQWNYFDTTRKVTAKNSGLYIVNVTEPVFKCVGTDTAELFVNKKVTSIAGADFYKCKNDSVYLKAKYTPLGFSTVVQWTDVTNKIVLGNNNNYSFVGKNTNADGGSSAITNYELLTKITEDTVTCFHKDTIKVDIKTLPRVKWQVLPPRCFADGDFTLISPNGGLVQFPQTNLY